VEAAIQAVLDRYGMLVLDAAFDYEGHLELAGLVATEEDKQRLLGSLMGEVPQVESLEGGKVWSREALATELTSLTRGVDLDEEISYRLEGFDVVVQGRLTPVERSRYRQLKRRLLSAVSPVFSLVEEVKFFELDPVAGWVEVEVDTEVEPEPEPESLALAEPVGEAVAGEASETESPEDAAAAAETPEAADLPPPPPAAPAASAEPTAARPGFRLNRASKAVAPAAPSADEEAVREELEAIRNFKNITVGPISWVVTGNGEKLLAGAQLPSGFVVERISQESVTLVRGDETRTVNLK